MVYKSGTMALSEQARIRRRIWRGDVVSATAAKVILEAFIWRDTDQPAIRWQGVVSAHVAWIFFVIGGQIPLFLADPTVMFCPRFRVVQYIRICRVDF
jgi:hypothetical protein